VYNHKPGREQQEYHSKDNHSKKSITGNSSLSGKIFDVSSNDAICNSSVCRNA
jgi:hypothetical protein